MKGIAIVPEEVRSVATQMAENNQVITARMSQLMDQLDGLKALWQGPAADSFHDARTDWADKVTQHNAALAAISQELLAAQLDFATNDDNGAGRILTTLANHGVSPAAEPTPS